MVCYAFVCGCMGVPGEESRRSQGESSWRVEGRSQGESRDWQGGSSEKEAEVVPPARSSDDRRALASHVGVLSDQVMQNSIFRKLKKSRCPSWLGYAIFGCNP